MVKPRLFCSAMETENEAPKTKRLDCNRNLYKSNKCISGTPLTSRSVVVKRKNVTYSDGICPDSDTMDITLIVDDQKINAHKNVLSSNSEYFDRMFTSSFKERDQDKIEINMTDVSYETLKTLIDFFYKSELSITEQNVQDLLIGSNILLLDDVCAACVDYLKTMIDIENCISMKDFADSLSLNDLYSLCLTFIMNNFRLIANTDLFLTISYDEIMLLIKDDNLYAKEDMVYDVVMKWIKYDPLHRSKYSTELLWYVRLPLVLNTYQGVAKVQEFQDAKINSLTSFRMEHRRPFRKGILILSHYPDNSTPEWYDAGSDQWRQCNCENCNCKTYQMVLAPPRYLSSCILLDNGRLFAVGGFQCERRVKYANMFDPMTRTWTRIPDMMFPRVRPYVVQLGTKVFVIGGFSECNYFSFTNMEYIEYYDLETKRWSPVRYSAKGSSLLRNDTFVTSVNGLIYIIGMNKSEFFNPSESLWCSIPELPERRESAAVCTLNGNIYIIGGHQYGHYLKSVWAYCTETNVWVSLADMNSPRSQSGAVVMNGFIYVFGGKYNSDSYSNTFEVYNPHDNKWKTSSALMNKNHGRCDIDAIVIDKNCTLFKRVFEDVSININH